MYLVEIDTAPAYELVVSLEAYCTLSRRLRFLPQRVRLRAIKIEAMSSARAFYQR